MSNAAQLVSDRVATKASNVSASAQQRGDSAPLSRGEESRSSEQKESCESLSETDQTALKDGVSSVVVNDCLIIGRDGSYPGDALVTPQKINLINYVLVPIERYFDEQTSASVRRHLANLS